jgi:DNA-binding XRE family transcriptional regulator
MRIDSTRVRRIRRERAWSQEKLAAIAGVSLRTIQRVESDGSGSLETNMALACALGVPTIELVSEDRPAPATIRHEGWVGVTAGVSGAVLGLIVGWSGVISWPLDGRARGTIFGLMGVMTGLTLAFAATLLKRVYKTSSPSSSMGDL